MAAKKRSRPLWPVALLLVAPVWVAVDLYGPQKTDIRNFNPNDVARMETGMWRSSYSEQRLQLFFQTARLLRTEYHLPYLRSEVAAWAATRAALVVQRGSGMADYRRALPYLGRYYVILRSVSKTHFDPLLATQLELNWWIIHRERASRPAGDLDAAIAAAAAEFYQVPPERLMEYAHLRAQAMLFRDQKAQAGSVTEADWNNIDELLRASWTSLHKAVNLS
jgi:hypothetical protein